MKNNILLTINIHISYIHVHAKPTSGEYMKFLSLTPIIFLLSSCSAGAVVCATSGVSGYAFKSGESDKLTSSYETSLVCRIKKELQEGSYENK